MVETSIEQLEAHEAQKRDYAQNRLRSLARLRQVETDLVAVGATFSATTRAKLVAAVPPCSDPTCPLDAEFKGRSETVIRPPIVE